MDGADRSAPHMLLKLVETYILQTHIDISNISVCKVSILLRHDQRIKALGGIFKPMRCERNNA